MTLDELTNRLSAKDNVHLNLNEELKIERSRVEVLHRRVIDLEKALDKKELERIEIERLSHSLRNAVSHADDEKAELLSTINDLRRDKDKSSEEISQLRDDLRSMVDKVDTITNKASGLEDWLNETKIAQQKSEQTWTDRLRSHEDNENCLRQRVLELEHEVSLVVCSWSISMSAAVCF